MMKYSYMYPHNGFHKLREMVWMAEKEDKYWVYHSGIDKMYLDCDFSPDRYTQAKGSLMDLQCRGCNQLIEDAEVHRFNFKVNRMDGIAINVPECIKCGKPYRPNINMRDDLEWMEEKVAK